MVRMNPTVLTQRGNDPPTGIEKEKLFHFPVMKREVFSILINEAKVNKGVIVDGTVGTGGHLSYLLKNSPPGISFLGIDIDPDAINFSRRLFQNFRNVFIYQANYINLPEIIKELNLNPVIGILFDFGVSRFQLETAERGFSFQKEGPLDMRFSKEGETALGLIRRASGKKLEKILWLYGEERDYKKIARAIVEKRRNINTTFDLKNVIIQAVKRKDKRKFARVFQALRIAVNSELENVERGIKRAIPLLTEGGRIVTITYHSLEDRIVKRIFKEKKENKEILIVTRKPIRPSPAEIGENPSSRSAKLRAAEKV